MPRPRDCALSAREPWHPRSGLSPSPSPVGAVPAALELVEDAVVLVEGAQLAAQVLVHLGTGTRVGHARGMGRRDSSALGLLYLVRLHGPVLHVDVPHLD